eukprot:1329046-Amorphochlora_amoeboformis.AAC.1
MYTDVAHTYTPLPPAWESMIPTPTEIFGEKYEKRLNPTKFAALLQEIREAVSLILTIILTLNPNLNPNPSPNPNLNLNLNPNPNPNPNPNLNLNPNPNPNLNLNPNPNPKEE